MGPQTDISRVTGPPAFASILCGVDGSRPSLEAARQAAILAGSDTALTYAAVTWEQGKGLTATATLTRKHAQDALHRARDDMRELGAVPEVIEDDGQHAAERLIELCRGHDLLVVGIHGHSRAGGIIIGSTAIALLHRSPIPVLVARRPAGNVAFPDRILVANDGSARAHEAARLAAKLALRHGAALGLVSAYDHGRTPKSLSEVAATVRTAAGVEPVRFGEGGPAARVIATAARDFDASLIVTGSRCLTGIAAIGSTSERIAHMAPCSVSVLRQSG